MKLKSSGVIVSILILILMMLICHTMNFFYPKSKFEDVSTNSIKPLKTDYNEIYYTNESDEKQLCSNLDQPEIPCDIVRTCKIEPTPKYTLSNSELAVLYKVAYEESAREIFTRTLKDLQTATTEPNLFDF